MTTFSDLWPSGSATGLGSLPGVDIREAVKFTLGELPALPYFPELPGRGPGADMIGRSGALLTELPIELYAGRWRVATHPGKDLRRASELWQRDLDELTEQADGYVGPLKLQCAGPWTLAASIELPLGGAILHDHGAVRDLAGSLAEGLREHVADMRRRVPGAQLLLQLDEPSLPKVLTGRVPTESGLHSYRAVDVSVARDALRSIVDAAGVPVIMHCCAVEAPLGLFQESGAAALSLDLGQLTTRLDPLGEALDAGLGLLAGVAPTTAPPDGRAPDAKALAERVRRLWHTLGFPAEQLTSQVVVTPTCGLAEASPTYAHAALAACVDAAKRLAEA
jgi:methionine synthase II (cobalamin-independent)